MDIRGFAAHRPKSALTDFSYPGHLNPFDVLVQVTHCGICHSDIHLIDNDWGSSKYPFIPGHEVVGKVKELGSGADHLKAGQRVGIGWQASACLNCEYCLQGDENCCAKNQATCSGGHHGGFAEQIIVDSRFAFPIPEELSSENAAPLLCAGITVYSPLAKYVRPRSKVGVIGIGGLGHLALQFANSYGCEVTAFSASADKEKECRDFGAHHFVPTKKLKDAYGTVDTLFSTVSADIDWAEWLRVLRPNGKIIVLGASPSDIKVPPFALIGDQKSIIGNNTGGRAMMLQMLEFAARHNIQAKTEVMPLSKVNEALDKVRTNKARYRMVLKV
jgi:alcohol/geraniol dehydrogenase (NADP+)